MENKRTVQVYMHIGTSSLIMGMIFFAAFLAGIGFTGYSLYNEAYQGDFRGALCVAVILLAFCSVAFIHLRRYYEKKRYNRQPLLATLDDEGITFHRFNRFNTIKEKIVWSAIKSIKVGRDIRALLPLLFLVAVSSRYLQKIVLLVLHHNFFWTFWSFLVLFLLGFGFLQAVKQRSIIFKRTDDRWYQISPTLNLSGIASTEQELLTNIRLFYQEPIFLKP